VASFPGQNEPYAIFRASFTFAFDFRKAFRILRTQHQECALSQCAANRANLSRFDAVVSRIIRDVARSEKEAKMQNENIERARRSVARKLSPDAISTSTVVQSLLAYLVGERWTYPYILSLACSPDGALCAWESESDGYRRLICKRSDLIKAILQLASMTDLTPRERALLLSEVPPIGKRRG
jgi:hypothetical protein